MQIQIWKNLHVKFGASHYITAKLWEEKKFGEVVQLLA